MWRLSRLREAVRVPAAEPARGAQRHLDALTKPPGSLGRLEELARRLVEVRGGEPPTVEAPVIFTFAADHGVVEEGVSAYPQVVTAQMVENLLRGGAAVNVLARQAGARLVVADFGLATPLAGVALARRRLGPGTRNIALSPAMSEADAVAAIEAGAALAEEAIASGADLVGLGEMGIGNTTAASAVTAAVTGAPVESVTGRGTGIDEDTWRRKVDVVRRALARRPVDRDDGVAILAEVGGFEIAGLTGVALAGAAHRVPVAVDGFVATAAALISVVMVPAVRHYLFASHRSAEPGHTVALAHLGLEPYLDLGLRLGEGTGAALFIHLARAAARLYAEMATFKSAGVDGPRAP
jgi:nicotinate-nucleotide--dimethylbenzimidazole phosphoribosyltransferase